MERRDHYGDGDWYDAEYVHIRGDVPYYARVAAETNGRILELACGTGRLTFPMANAGGLVHGVDLAPSMIRRAEAKRQALPATEAERLVFLEGDMRSVRVQESFQAVVLGFNTLMHMIADEDLGAALETVSAHLPVGGRFHFDLHTPFPELLARDPEGRFDPQEMVDPHTGDRYIVTENNTYDARTQVNHMRFYYQRVDRFGTNIGEEVCADLQLRVIFPRELDAWLHATGFEIEGEWDDFERQSPFSGRGGRRVVVAIKRA